VALVQRVDGLELEGIEGEGEESRCVDQGANPSICKLGRITTQHHTTQQKTSLLSIATIQELPRFSDNHDRSRGSEGH
jgi:hypothetical protein